MIPRCRLDFASTRDHPVSPDAMRAAASAIAEMREALPRGVTALDGDGDDDRLSLVELPDPGSRHPRRRLRLVDHAHGREHHVTLGPCATTWADPSDPALGARDALALAEVALLAAARSGDRPDADLSAAVRAVARRSPHHDAPSPIPVCIWLAASPLQPMSVSGEPLEVDDCPIPHLACLRVRASSSGCGMSVSGMSGSFDPAASDAVARLRDEQALARWRASLGGRS